MNDVLTRLTHHARSNHGSANAVHAEPAAMQLQSTLASAGGSPDGTDSEIERERESVLDHALEATFPASDPLSVTQPGGGPQPRGTDG